MTRRSTRPASAKRARAAPKPRGSRAPRAPRRSGNPQQPRSRSRLRLAAFAAALAALLALAGLLGWARWAGAGPDQALILELAPQATNEQVAAALVARGLLGNPELFRLYAALPPRRAWASGEHLLTGGLSPRELLQRLTRHPGRSSVRVSLPEGLQHLEMAERLERARICSRRAFRAAVSDPGLLAELGLSGSSAEGYLFPATYQLLPDSDARAVVRVLVGKARRRLSELGQAHPGAFEKLAARGIGERDVLTLASLVEKEARVADERRIIASVFFNRLDDASFRPARMLQSDPSAAYACQVLPAPQPASCAGYHGRVTPAMLRDETNPYNTYRHAGLPPGPIANPGAGSIEAVLAPETTEYLYFVAKGAGRHAFSRSFAEHREVIEAGH